MCVRVSQLVLKHANMKVLDGGRPSELLKTYHGKALHKAYAFFAGNPRCVSTRGSLLAKVVEC